MDKNADLRAAERNTTVMYISKPEEGPAAGEGWVVFRAAILLVSGILVLGYLIA
ncbi:MAG: hypothetical protein JWR10_1693 [Rubritepida sp.]|nr:hypothetical protein [Rubritepida sp.]